MCQPTNPTSTLSQTQQGRPSPVAFCQLRCNTSGDAELTDRKVAEMEPLQSMSMSPKAASFMDGKQTSLRSALCQ